MKGADNDIDCLRRIQAGDTAALGELYDRYNPLLYSLVLRILRSPADAEDALQEAWLQVWKRAPSFDPARGSVGAWLTTVARTRALDRYRSMRSRNTAESKVETARHRQIVDPSGPDAPEGAVAAGGVGVNVPEDLLELAAGYALGSLDEADRARVEALLASGKHPELKQAVAEFREASALIATGAQAAMPSPALKGRVMAAIAAEPARASVPAAAPARSSRDAVSDSDRGRIMEMKPRSALWVHLGWATAVAACLMAALVSWNDSVRLERELMNQRGQISELESKLAEERRWSEVMTAPGTREAALEMTTSGEAAMRGRALYNPRTRSAVIAFENVQVPSGQELELWALREGGVLSLGLLKPGADGRATMRLNDVGDPSALVGFAVTLEKPGGSGNPNAPGGPIVMAGKFPS